MRRIHWIWLKMCEKETIVQRRQSVRALANIHMGFVIKLWRTEYKSQSIIFKCTHIFAVRMLANT